MLTVRHIFQMEIMKGSSLSTSDSGLDNPVEWISVIEVPVENFVRENEMVLSTAVGCGHDPILFHRFVEALIQAKASALALATQRYITDIPPKTLILAEQNRMPIITIPWSTRFSDIVQQVIRELDRHQDQINSFSRKIQEELLQLILQGADLNKLAHVIHRKLKLPVLFVDQKGQIKGSSPNSQLLATYWAKHLDGWDFPINRDKKWSRYEFGKKTCIEIPILSARKIQGSLLLLIPHKQEAPFSQHDQIYLDHVTTAAALCFLQENIALETESRLQNDFVWSLAKGEFSSIENIQKKAEPLGYNTSLPYVCILGQVEPKTNGDDLRDSPTREIMDEIYYAGRSLHRNVLSTRQLNQIILFLEVPVDRVIDTVQSFLDIVDGRIYERYPNWSVSWGIGEKQAGIYSFRASYLDACSALDIGRRQKGPGHRNFYMDTGLYRALQQLAGHPDMQEITWSTMHRLLDYSKQRGIDLVETFTSYLRNQCNVSQTARELNLHRQSLLYRLRKIESLTGRSLFNPDDLFLLQLSIKLWTSSKNDST